MEEKTIFPFTIGADPEVNILLQNNLVAGTDIMGKIFKTNDAGQNSGLNIKDVGNFGSDGQSGELRPKESNSPEEVIKNIQTLLKEANKEMEVFDLTTLSMHSTIGGHIHLSLPRNNMTNAEIANIHKKIASFYLPLIMGENKINLQIRKQSSYGRITDYRYENFGNTMVYEFRTPSAEWLTTPKIAKATLSYIGTVYNEILNQQKNFSKCTNIIFKTEKQGSALQELILSNYPNLTKNLNDQIKKHIKTFEFYPKCKKEIDYILNHEKVLEDKKKAGYNLKIGWNLQKPSKIPTKKELDKKKVENKGKLDIANLTDCINFSINNDHNVKLFSQELAKRMIAFNWKLNNKYYFFGLRKGIKENIAMDAEKLHYYCGKEQIKTIEDKNIIEETFNRMWNRFEEVNGQQKINIDIKTGEISKKTKNAILIGIPYEDRMEMKIKPFLNTILEIEKGKIPTKIELSDLVDAKEQGEISKIYNETEVLIDTNSRMNESRAQNRTLEILQQVESEENGELREEN